MKKILTAIAALLACGSLYAQIDPTVEVSRQYKVNIADIDRPLTADHSVADSLQKFDVGFDYSIFNRPYTDLYEFTPYQTDSISKVVTKRPPYLMAQIGSQFPVSADLQLRSQIVTRPTFNIGIDSDMKITAAEMDYLGEDNALGTVRFAGGVSANMKRAWKKGELTAVLGYDNRSVGDTYMDNVLAHSVNVLTTDISLVSADAAEKSVFYNINFNYNATSKGLSDSKLIDTTFINHKMSLQGALGSSFDKHRIYVNMLYQSAVTGRGEEKVNVGILEFMPIYEYTLPRLKLRAGARFGNTYIGSDAATTIHPDLDIKGEVVKNTIWIRGVLSGGNELNSMADYLRDAPWLCNSVANHVSAAPEAIGVRNLVGKVSIETVIAGRFALSPYFAYGNYSNKLQLRTVFNDDKLPILVPEYSDYVTTQLGMETSWKSKNLTITANLVHTDATNATETTVYMVPEWKAGASLEFNIKRRLFLNAAYSFESQRANWAGTIPDYNDLTVVVTWVFNRHFSAYLKGGNLLNNPNYRYFAIPEMPLNLGGGVRINF